MEGQHFEEPSNADGKNHVTFLDEGLADDGVAGRLDVGSEAEAFVGIGHEIYGGLRKDLLGTAG